eukprot:CAMPEP_0115023844 /NCGR_PEP_ID=MMETSP0216-20121206/32713_1 /TAXON_ID=223996 /ORGANISM="Protocruzia adherens, Strain Boccale" /LENGTH=457 /DNA_ID=CAMNT_0002397447 /DNA_START=594 /DNA_END=1967 /DNA_ORIENTATION=+
MDVYDRWNASKHSSSDRRPDDDLSDDRRRRPEDRYSSGNSSRYHNDPRGGPKRRSHFDQMGPSDNYKRQKLDPNSLTRRNGGGAGGVGTGGSQPIGGHAYMENAQRNRLDVEALTNDLPPTAFTSSATTRNTPTSATTNSGRKPAPSDDDPLSSLLDSSANKTSSATSNGDKAAGNMFGGQQSAVGSSSVIGGNSYGASEGIGRGGLSGSRAEGSVGYPGGINSNESNPRVGANVPRIAEAVLSDPELLRLYKVAYNRFKCDEWTKEPLFAAKNELVRAVSSKLSLQEASLWEDLEMLFCDARFKVRFNTALESSRKYGPILRVPRGSTLETELGKSDSFKAIDARGKAIQKASVGSKLLLKGQNIPEIALRRREALQPLDSPSLVIPIHHERHRSLRNLHCRPVENGTDMNMKFFVKMLDVANYTLHRPTQNPSDIRAFQDLMAAILESYQGVKPS